MQRTLNQGRATLQNGYFEENIQIFVFSWNITKIKALNGAEYSTFWATFWLWESLKKFLRVLGVCSGYLGHAPRSGECSALWIRAVRPLEKSGHAYFKKRTPHLGFVSYFCKSSFQCKHEQFALGLFSILIQRSHFGVASYPSIFKPNNKRKSAPNFPQLVRHRHSKKLKCGIANANWASN